MDCSVTTDLARGPDRTLLRIMVFHVENLNSPIGFRPINDVNNFAGAGADLIVCTSFSGKAYYCDETDIKNNDFLNNVF